MELYLQFGYGMIGHTTDLLSEWGGGAVILSPRDLEHERLVRVAGRILEDGSEVLLDPQCFLRDADHHRLTEHRYWSMYQRASSTSSLLDGVPALLEALRELNDALGTSRLILPGLLAEPVSEDWLAIHAAMAARARDAVGDLPLLATVALGYGAVMDESQVEAVVERAAEWPVDGFYVVTETQGPYLVEEPGWLANVLILDSGLRLQRRNVIHGYANHQMLCLAACNVDALASGTWLNVRSFGSGRFFNRDDDAISRRTKWYYHARALSEYKVPFLDIAHRNGVLARMAPDEGLGSRYADPLFAGPAPSTVSWGESDAFRHYLTCLRAQCEQVSAGSYGEAMDKQAALLDACEEELDILRANGVLDRGRDFGGALDANRSGLITFNRARAARLRREW